MGFGVRLLGFGFRLLGFGLEYFWFHTRPEGGGDYGPQVTSLCNTRPCTISPRLVTQSLKGRVRNEASARRQVQGYLAHEKLPHPRTLQLVCAYGPTVVWGVGSHLLIPTRSGSNSTPQRSTGQVGPYGTGRSV